MKKCKIKVLRAILKLKFPTKVKGNTHKNFDDNLKKDSNFYNDNNEVDIQFNNKDEEVYRDTFEKNTMDYLLQDGLKEEIILVKMSHNLKESIMENTIKQPQSLYKKFYKILNRTVEIPVSYVCTVCIIIFISSTLSTFIVTDSMKMNKNLQGYTNIRVLNISGSNVILPKDMSEVIGNEKN